MESRYSPSGCPHTFSLVGVSSGGAAGSGIMQHVLLDLFHMVFPGLLLSFFIPAGFPLCYGKTSSIWAIIVIFNGRKLPSNIGPTQKEETFPFSNKREWAWFFTHLHQCKLRSHSSGVDSFTCVKLDKWSRIGLNSLMEESEFCLVQNPSCDCKKGPSLEESEK